MVLRSYLPGYRAYIPTNKGKKRFNRPNEKFALIPNKGGKKSKKRHVINRAVDLKC